jgi:ribonuclease HI
MGLPYPNSLHEIILSEKNIILTDGASRGNPGAAGWAYILLSGEQKTVVENCGHSPKDTNNRMEIQSCLEAFKCAKELKLKNQLIILSDSKFVIEATRSWRFSWRKKNWHKSDGSPVLHVDLWKELDILADELSHKFFHIEAHKGHPANTRCDLLAVEAALQENPKLFKGSLENYPHFQKISLESIYSSPRYLCWNQSKKIEFEKWPQAQEFMQKNPGFRVKKIFSPEE